MRSRDLDIPFSHENKSLLIEAHGPLLFRKDCSSSPHHSQGRHPHKASRSPTCCHSTYISFKNQLNSGIFCTLEAGSHVFRFWLHLLLHCETLGRSLSLSEPTVRHGPTVSPRKVALRITYEHVCKVPTCLLHLDVCDPSIIHIICC